MTADPIIVLSWLLLAHLVADFVLQSGRMAADKSGSGAVALRATAVHSVVVAVCLLPFAFAFEGPGAAVLLAIAVSHGVIDRAKVVLTRRAEARAMLAAHRVHEAPAPAASLGNAWTPVPAALFALDQLAHVAVSAVAWAAILRTATLNPSFASAVASLAGADGAGFHRAVLTGVVLAGLGIVNVRAGALFVAILVHPASVVARTPAEPVDRDVAVRPPAAYSVTLGPLHGRLEPDTPQPPPPARTSPERIGEAIGILERVLVAALILAHAEAAIGLVIAAKTVARFRQLDDRDFAEYYLLGTLCSVLVAVLSALVAAATLATIA